MPDQARPHVCAEGRGRLSCFSMGWQRRRDGRVPEEGGRRSGDVVFSDLLDRDAGCFEAATDPIACAAAPSTGTRPTPTSPNFQQYLDWSKRRHDGRRQAMIWWQIRSVCRAARPAARRSTTATTASTTSFRTVQEFVRCGRPRRYLRHRRWQSNRPHHRRRRNQSGRRRLLPAPTTAALTQAGGSAAASRGTPSIGK